MRYWYYKCNAEDVGNAAYGDWRQEVFSSKKEVEWGGDWATRSPESQRLFREEMAVGDVVVAFQTHPTYYRKGEIIGFCRVTNMDRYPGVVEMYLKPIHELQPGFRIHEHKQGTILKDSPAVNGPVTLREFEAAEMRELVALCMAPRWVLVGRRIRRKPQTRKAPKQL
jgi:hypothetical protein